MLNLVRMGQKQSQNVSSNDLDQLSYDEHLQNLISKNKILIFSKTNCIYCSKAKSILDQFKLDYKAIELDVKQNCPNENCDQLVKSLIWQTRIRTVPQIFINGKFIGGFNDLEKLSRDKENFFKIFE